MATCVVVFMVIATWLSCTIRKQPAVSEPSLGLQYLKEASKWATIASDESNAVLAMMHANYALCCANVAKALCSDDKMHEHAGIRIDTFISDVTALQESVVRDLGKQCPSVRPTAALAEASGWM